MDEVRRLPVVALLVCLLVLGAVLGRPTGIGGAQAVAPPTPAPSEAPALALSSSWYCAGGTFPGGVAPGDLLVDNAGPVPVKGTVSLVWSSGLTSQLGISVPSGSDQLVPEDFVSPFFSPFQWVGAIVTLFGGMASVSQVISTHQGSASQPCASSTSSQWYFPDGAVLRNASEYISLLNPYPEAAVADLSFTTELGQEEPDAFRGVVVPAHGLTVLDLGSHLRRRTHIAATVTTRAGGIVAFQTEIVTKPPARAPPGHARGAGPGPTSTRDRPDPRSGPALDFVVVA